MDISMDIHRKPVDMDMDMDGKFHIHGKPGKIARDVVSVLNVLVSRRSRDVFWDVSVSSRSCDLTSCGHP